MMIKLPKVFIVVLNYNGKDCLAPALASLFKVNYPNFEIILVDNGSSDGSFELAKRHFSKIIFIRNDHNLGFAAGNNIGIAYAMDRRADFVLLLNNDTLVEKDFLLNLIETVEKNKNIGIASPVIWEGSTSRIWFSGGKINWWRMKAFHKRQERRDDYLGSHFISGCAMLIKAEVIEKIGFLDDNFFLYLEDADFSRRAKKAGYDLAVSAKSRIRHFEKSEKGKEKVYWLVVSGLIFFQKNSPAWLNPWIYLYVRLRKIKNYFDIKFRKTETAELVRKAYADYARERKSA